MGSAGGAGARLERGGGAWGRGRGGPAASGKRRRRLGRGVAVGTEGGGRPLTGLSAGGGGGGGGWEAVLSGCRRTWYVSGSGAVG